MKILITGASSGIGQALAERYARLGHDVALAARRKDRLDELAAKLYASEDKCGSILTYKLDVTDPNQTRQVIEEAYRELGNRLDLVIANAGVGGVRSKVGETPLETVGQLVETNLLGAMYTIEMATRLFARQSFGHVAVISSVSSLRGLPGGAVYCATKAGINTYLDALRAENYANPKMFFTTINAGFIDTDLNRHIAHRPFLITVESAADSMVKHIGRKTETAFVPAWPYTFLGPLLKMLPHRTLGKIAAKKELKTKGANHANINA